MTTVVLSEVFGPTVQGEGPSTGRRAGFIRLGRCNLDCTWCDTPYTWDWTGKNGHVYVPSEELSTVDVESVVAAVEVMRVPLVVITGGEPLNQPKAVAAIVDQLVGYAVEIETNGTRTPGWEHRPWVSYNVSPKLANSGVDEVKRYNPDALDWFAGTPAARFKFVVQGSGCLDEVDTLVEVHGIDPARVWVMPEGRSVEEINSHGEAVADLAIKRGYNISGRLHVALWGSKRGV